VVERLSIDLDEVFAEYRDHKRSAALFADRLTCLPPFPAPVEGDCQRPGRRRQEGSDLQDPAP